MAATSAQHTFPPGYLEQSRVANILAGNIILHVLSTIFVFARLYSRAIILRSVYSDDYVIIVAWLFGTGSNIVAYVQTRYGIGRHIEAIEVQNLAKIQCAGLFGLICFGLSLTATKLSICISYLRIFYFERGVRMLLYVTLATIVIAGTILGLYPLFQCTPTSAFWTRTSNTDTRCGDLRPAFYSNSALNILTDVALMAIVIPSVLKLTLPRRQKIALLAVISMGGLAIIAATIRTYRTSKMISGEIDPVWQGYDASLWIALEIHTSLFCAAAPTIKPLLARLAPGLLDSITSGSGNAGYRGAKDEKLRQAAVKHKSDDIEYTLGTKNSWIELEDEGHPENSTGKGQFISSEIKPVIRPDVLSHQT